MSYDEKRILQVFETNEVPNVSSETLEIYLEHIKRNWGQVARRYRQSI